MLIPSLGPTSGFRHTYKFKKFVSLITMPVYGWGDYASPLPSTPATIPIMNTAARTNKPNAKKFYS